MEALLLIFLSLSTLSSSVYAATDTIFVNDSLRDGETIVSAGHVFELGFFTPLANSSSTTSASKNRYLGIWYTFSRETVVWVANGETPLNDTSGVLRVTKQGMFVGSSSNNLSVWSSTRTNASNQARNPIAQLLDTGNFVYREAGDSNKNNYIWESFGFGGAGDTLLAGSKWGKNLATGSEWYLASWKSASDPSFGDTIVRLDTSGYPQYFKTVNGSVVFRSGPWNGFNFEGLAELRPNPFFSYQLVHNEEEIYIRYELINSSVFFRMAVFNGGVGQHLVWNDSSRKWETYAQIGRDDCDKYGVCGAFGSCNMSTNNLTACNCLPGFTPRFPQAWASGNWSGGCTRMNEFVCGAEETFQRIDGVKLPDARNSWFNRAMDLTECEKMCKQNCSCTAYSTLDVPSGDGCLLWFKDLLDIRQYDGNGQFFYLKTTLESGHTGRSRSFGKNKLLAGIIISSAMSIGILIGVMIIYIYCKKHRNQAIRNMHVKLFDNKEGKEEMKFPIFDLVTIAQATTNFSKDNMIGEGGFGLVYKGKFVGGQEIAVKRLSKYSRQGVQELKNEVELISRLQHRNLVRLLGCCIEGNEKMLIYEFMPNKSLDYFIFDEERRKLLDWNMHILIIVGIASGLVYLHQDSRLRIIHRDLKASNILLDSTMNQKISDFDLARMMVEDQTEDNTKKVFGTFGYMCPEYAINGRFSTKSDVFSFGILVLEIISGKRNRGFSSHNDGHNLLSHAWKLWTDGRPLELVPDTLVDSYAKRKVERCICIGLLCVQGRLEDRPSMASVILMLSNDSPLPNPKQPGFYTSQNIMECSNEMSITLPDGR